MIFLFADLLLPLLHFHVVATSSLPRASQATQRCTARPFARVEASRRCSIVCDPLSRLQQQPHSRGFFKRAVANLLLRASHRFRNSMRPTGEASEPVSGGSFALASQPHRASWLQGSQSGANLTGRFRNRKLVVSRSHSKRFFAEYLQGCIFTSWQCELVIDRWS